MGTCFDTNSTGISFYDGILKNPAYYEAAKGKVGRVVLMSPDEYIRQAAKLREVPTTYEEELRGVADQLVREYVERVCKGEKMPLLLLDTTTQAQDGRHRAIAAKCLGLAKVPVLVVKKGREPWQIPRGEYGAAKCNHEHIVRQALSAGKPVPAQVLEDYPKLVGRHDD